MADRLDPTAPAEAKFCSQCGVVLAQKSKFCSACGAAVYSGLSSVPPKIPSPKAAHSGSTPQQPPPLPIKKTSSGCLRFFISFVVIILIIAAGLAAYGYYVSKQATQGNDIADSSSASEGWQRGMDPNKPDTMLQIEEARRRLQQSGHLLSPQENNHYASGTRPSSDSSSPTQVNEFFADEKAVLDQLAKQSSPDRTLIEKLAKIRFRHAVDLQNYSIANRKPGFAAMATAYAESATQLSPDTAEYQVFFARLCLENTGESDYGVLLAENALRQAISSNSSLATARLLLGRLLSDQKRYDAALGEFEAVLRNDSSLAEPALMAIMVNAYIKDGQAERGERFLSSLPPKTRASSSLITALADLLEDQGKLAEAQAIRSKAQGGSL